MLYQQYLSVNTIKPLVFLPASWIENKKKIFKSMMVMFVGFENNIYLSCSFRPCYYDNVVNINALEKQKDL